MTKNTRLNDILKDLPAKRRKRIEAGAERLKAEYVTLSALSAANNQCCQKTCTSSASS